VGDAPPPHPPCAFIAAEAQHVSSQEIDVVSEPHADGGKPTIKEVKLGRYYPGGQHRYVLVGSL
jgi:hypothetical protein